MNKNDCVDRYFEILKETDPWVLRIEKLVDANRVTAGAGFILYSPYEWYGTRRINEIIDKSHKSKNPVRYRKRIKVWDWNYYINDMEQKFKKMKEFIIEQEQLPFEQTQYQILKREGKLK